MKFEKGQSGNPTGRTKEMEKTFSELLLRDRVKAYNLLWKATKKGETWACTIYFCLLIPELKKMEKVLGVCHNTNPELKQMKQILSFCDN